jgi:hypothetical protein
MPKLPPTRILRPLRRFHTHLLRGPVGRCLPNCLFGRIQGRTARFLLCCLLCSAFRGLLRRTLCRLLRCLLCRLLRRQFQLPRGLLP